MSNQYRFSDLKRLAEAATPGPWSYWGETAQEIFVSTNAPINPGTPVLQARWDYKRENFEFIAAANPAAVLDLLAEVESLRKDAERYRWLRAKDSYRREDNGWLGAYEGGRVGCVTEYEPVFGDDLDEMIDASMTKEKSR